jgi:hypothetical protein
MTLKAEKLQVGNPQKVRCISCKQGNILSYADASYKDILITDQFSFLCSFLVHIFVPPEIVVSHRINTIPFSVHYG